VTFTFANHFDQKPTVSFSLAAQGEGVGYTVIANKVTSKEVTITGVETRGRNLAASITVSYIAIGKAPAN
jgi:hypothetical protein